MIERMLWPDPDDREPPQRSSAFAIRGFVRPLRLTFHDAGLDNLPAAEAVALRVVEGFASRLSAFDAVRTGVGPRPYIRFSEATESVPKRPPIAEIYADGKIRQRGTMYQAAALPRVAARLLDENGTDLAVLTRDLTIIEAHRSLGRDILITNADYLLKHRFERFINEGNPHTPTQALKMVALFLRTCENFTYAADASYLASANRGEFYRQLTLARLANMEHYVHACAGTGLGDLGHTVRERCTRALEALDAIGAQFYALPNGDTIDRMLYHFDYLTLLLVGAFDVMALVTHRAFDIADIDPKFAKFTNDHFIAALQRVGATAHLAVVTKQRWHTLQALLYDLRNMIHTTTMTTALSIIDGNEGPAYAVVSHDRWRQLWKAVEREGGLDHWGMQIEADIRIEPYTYATRLIAYCFAAITDLAEATLQVPTFAAGIAQIPETNERINELGMRRQIGLLG